MATLFIADTHFGHAGALALYRRPFASVVQMDAAMVERWNQAVDPTDQVWHVGDFAVRQTSDRIADLLGMLKGVKHLITGNNDIEATTASEGWASVRPRAALASDAAVRRGRRCLGFPADHIGGDSPTHHARTAPRRAVTRIAVRVLPIQDQDTTAVRFSASKAR